MDANSVLVDCILRCGCCIRGVIFTVYVNFYFYCTVILEKTERLVYVDGLGGIDFQRKKKKEPERGISMDIELPTEKFSFVTGNPLDYWQLLYIPTYNCYPCR